MSGWEQKRLCVSHLMLSLTEISISGSRRWDTFNRYCSQPDIISTILQYMWYFILWVKKDRLLFWRKKKTNILRLGRMKKTRQYDSIRSFRIHWCAPQSYQTQIWCISALYCKKFHQHFCVSTRLRRFFIDWRKVKKKFLDANR